MDQQLAAITLSEDLEGLDYLDRDEAGRWEIQRAGPVELLVTVAPASDPTERYLARLYWPGHPDQPPSVRFVDPATGSVDLSTAWPVFTGARPPGDICVPWTSEGQTLHGEWTADPGLRWDPRGNVLLKVLRTLQDLLDHEYTGRSA